LEYKKILIINPFGIGDVLFTTPLLHALKKAMPEASLAYLCNSRSREILKDNPYIDRIFVYDRDEFEAVRSSSFFAWLRKIFAFIQDIRKERFDAALDLSLNKEYGFFSLCAGIKERIGYDYKKRGLFLNKKVFLGGYQDKHVIEYYGELLKYFNLSLEYKSPELYINESDKKRAGELLLGQGADLSGNLVVIAPAGGKSWGKDASLKHWPPANFAALADKLIEKKQVTIIIVGSNSEKEIALNMLAAMHLAAVNLCGMTSLGELTALLSRASLVIANDGGPLHMAVALGKNTVSFFGPVDPKVYGPYPLDYKKHAVLNSSLDCVPCYRNFRLKDCVRTKACLESITVEQAFQAALKLF